MKTLLVFGGPGKAYGVWEEDVAGLREAALLHRLPHSPATIAGLTIIDDKSATLADLQASIGFAPLDRQRAGTVLIVDASQKIIGFAVESAYRRLPVPPEALLPIPDYARTEAVDSCVISNEELIPVVRVKPLLERLCTGDLAPVVSAFTTPQRATGGPAAREAYRLFDLAGEVFAADAAHIEPEPASPGPITGLPGAPSYVRGLCRYRDRILTVIDLAQRLSLNGAGERGVMLVATFSGSPFGLLVEGDRGAAPRRGDSVKALPPVAESPAISTALLMGSEPVPILDIEALLLRDQDQLRVPAADARYKTSSGVFAAFGKEQLAVVEFAFLGSNHAVPKTEAGADLPVLPLRRLRNLPAIIPGIALHKGNIVPVVDLAMIFGRRTPLGAAARMIVVENGDFRALLLCESLRGDRTVAPEIQRPVPIVLPHHVVYGCYVGAGSVQLILNVAALCIYFETASVRDIMDTFTASAPALAAMPEQETAAEYPGFASAAAAAPDLQELAAAAPATQGAAIPPAVDQEPGTPEHVPAPALSAAEEPALQQAQDERQRAEEQERLAAEERRQRAAEETARAEAEARAAEAARLQAAEEARLRAEAELREAEAERARAEAAAGAQLEEQIRLEDERRLREQAERLQQEEERTRQAEDEARRVAEEQARAAEAARLQAAEEARLRAEAEAREAEAERARADEEARAQAEERARLDAERARHELDLRLQKEAERARLAEEERLHAQELEREAAQLAAAEEAARREEEVRQSAAQEEQVNAAMEPSVVGGAETVRDDASLVAAAGPAEREHPVPSHDAGRGRTKEHHLRTAAVEKLITAAQEHLRAEEKLKSGARAGAWSANRDRQGIDVQQSGGDGQATGTFRRTVTVVGAAALVAGLLYAAGQLHRVQPPVIETTSRPEDRGKKPGDAAGKGDNQKGLVLDVAELPAGAVDALYIVRKGDTLWHIAKRFTGNPFNYPRIAGENKIANPDLIFPGQTIQLKKKAAP